MAVRGDNSLYFSTGLDNTGLQRGAGDAIGIVQDLAGSIARINPFAALVIGAASAFAAIANEGYKMAKDFESAMAEVKTIAGLPQKEFDELTRKVFDLYTQLGTEPPDGLARGLYDIIGSGYEAADALELLEIAAKAATAGVTTTAVASDGLTTILNAFGLEAKDAARVADVMFAAVDRGKISFEELSRQIAQVAPLAAASGFSFEEIAGAIATLTKQGTPGAQAMTQIRSAIEAANEVLGEGASKSLTLQQAFQKLYDEAGGGQNKLKELTGRVEAVNAVLAIAGPNLQGATEDMLAMSEAAGSVDRAFDIITETTANQWEIFGNRVKAKSYEIGNAVLEMSNGIAANLNRIIGPTESLSKKYEDQAEKVNELYAEYKDLNTEESRRIEILAEIERINPSVVAGINSQTDAYDKLGEAVRRFNEYALNKTIVDDKFGDDLNNIQEVVNRFSKQQRETGSDLYKEYAEFLGGLPKLQSSYQKELNKIIDSEDDRLEKIRKIRALLVDSNASGQKRVDVPFSDLEQYDNLGKTLGTLEERYKKTQKAADNYARSLSDNNRDSGFVIQEIQNINSLQELNAKYGKFETESIKEAVSARQDYLKERIKIEGILQELNSVSIQDYKANNEALKKYLESDNEEIVKAAKARQRALNSNYTPTGSGAGGTVKDAFIEMLKSQEDKYKAYEAVVNQIGQEIADKQFESLLKQGADYGEFLKNKLAQTKSFADQQKIAVAAENAGIDLNREIAKFVSTLDPITVPIDVEINNTSIDYIRRQLRAVEIERDAASDTDRPDIQDRVNYWRKRLEEAEEGTEDEKNLYEDVYRALDSLTHQQLRDYIEYWRQRLNVANLSADQITEIEGKISDAQRAVWQKHIEDISEKLRSSAEIFRNIGEEGMADLLNGLVDVTRQVDSLFKVLDENTSEGEVISAGIGAAIDLTGMIISASAKRKKAEEDFYNSVISQQKEYNRLLNEQVRTQASANDNVFTEDYINKIEKGIDALKLANSSYQDSLNALSDGQVKIGQRNAVDINNVLKGAGSGAVLGAAIGSVVPVIGNVVGAVVGGVVGAVAGLFGGKKKKDQYTSLLEEYPELIKTAADGQKSFNVELAQTLVDQKLVNDATKILIEDTIAWQEQIDKAKEQIAEVVEVLAGDLGSSLRDSLVTAFEQGGDAAQAMGDTISDVLEDIVEQLIFDQIFSEQFKKLQKEMEKSFDVGGDNSFADDFARFFEVSKGLTDQFNQALRDAQNEAESFGFDILNGDGSKAQGLSGAITAITEDTANILAGYLNAMRLDVRQGLVVNQQAVTYLAQIEVNTRYNRYLETIDGRFASIESAILQFQAGG
ncbi:phage tail tape measure protein [Leeuwenhoekiella sp. MAR_2009_132]|uniref:phage tail tape measure protein n=1 Tax=Leeuwenhoekiella sp. MAR_2009_132 TaxID=1392489 RepID=UPI00048D14C2|nr:phage tail tape measure protein [Leeuwenhoekiella sp. MAR_2009_132]